MDDSRFVNVNFDSLLSRLYAVAQGLFARQGLKGDASILPGTGKSAEDLVLDTVQAFVQGEKIKWRPEHPDEDPYPLLLIAMKRDFLDLVRKGRAYKRTIVVDSVEEEENSKRTEQGADLEEGSGKAEDDETKVKIYSLLEGNKELEEYVEAILELGLKKPNDIAEILGITTGQVRSRQRKVRTKLAGWHRSVMTRYRGKGN
jgi:DNA-directed RNA polymerase specialized sigma24 family protein